MEGIWRSARVVVVFVIVLTASSLGAQTPQWWSNHLQQELGLHIASAPECDGAMSVVTFEMGTSGGRIRMYAVVRLDWPPGMRQRPFEAASDTPELAFEQLLNLVMYYYATTWPGCVI